MKFDLLLSVMLLSFHTYAQDKKDTIRVIAKLIRPEGGSKIQFTSFKVLKVLQGDLSNDTIWVGYEMFKEPKSYYDTVLLTFFMYKGIHYVGRKMKKLKPKEYYYYIFPEQDAEKGIEEIRKDFIDIKMKQLK